MREERAEAPKFPSKFLVSSSKLWKKTSHAAAQRRYENPRGAAALCAFAGEIFLLSRYDGGELGGEHEAECAHQASVVAERGREDGR